MKWSEAEEFHVRKGKGGSGEKGGKEKMRQILNCTQPTGKGTDPAWAEKGVVRKNKRKIAKGKQNKKLRK